MQLRLLTEPAKPIMTVDEAKAHLCLPPDFTEQQVSIQNYIDAATTFMDGATGVLNRGLITQTWTGILDDFPSVFLLPLPPAQSVTEIRYVDTAGADQTVTASNYRVAYTGVDSRMALVEPVSGFVWPSVDNIYGAVEIDFVVGYSTLSTGVPGKVLQLARFLVADMFYRHEANLGASVTENPIYKTMLNNAKFWSA